jgi:NAD(P)H dehydrogenase (quinone)
MSEKFLVTGATGKTAELVIAQLLAKKASVRALVRDAAKAQPLKDKGVELAIGDLDKPETLAAALDGVTSVFLVTPPHPDADGMVERFLSVATKSASRPRIVRLSAIKGSDHGPTDNTRTHGRADRAIQDSGLPYVILRPNYFMQNLFGSAESILSQGMMFQGTGEGRLGFIDVRDIADVATAALLDEQWDRGIYELTGPEALSYGDVAKLLGEALGREVKYVPVTPEQVRESILKLGWGDWAAGIMADYSAAYAKGWGDFTTTFVEKIAGHPPRSYATFLREVFVPATRSGKG